MYAEGVATLLSHRAAETEGGLRFVFFSIITEANNSAANSKTTQCH